MAYIDREAAIERINNLPYPLAKKSWLDGVADAIGQIKATPAADVAPARNGRWILRGKKILCSCCEAVFAEIEEQDLFEVNKDLPYLADIEKFCFNCGAKMDGGDEGNE